jgi:hypothetical protein
MWRKQFYLFTKFRDLLSEVGNAEIALTSSQRKRLESQGYFGGVTNPNLHVHSYCMGCLCDFCADAPKKSQKASLMVSFAYPISENALCKDLVSFWSYKGIYRFPYQDYKSCIHLSPPIADSDHGYIVFTFSIFMWRNLAIEHANSCGNIFENIVAYVKNLIDYYERSIPQNYTAETFRTWMEEMPNDLVHGSH